jgi:hypothetical protein
MKHRFGCDTTSLFGKTNSRNTEFEFLKLLYISILLTTQAFHWHGPDTNPPRAELISTTHPISLQSAPVAR